MTQTGLMTLLQQVLSEASGQVNGGNLEDLDDVNIKAQMAFEALCLSEARRRSYRSVQAAIVVQIMRESKESGPLWLAYPPTDEYPRGFGNLREFLTAAGLSKSTVSELGTLATRVLPYCDEHEISIEPYITERKYPLLVEASSSLRRTIAGDDTGYTVEGILDDVMRAGGRDVVRAKYRRARSKVGCGSVNYLEDDRAVITILLPSTEDVGVVLSKLAGTVGWDELVATVRARRRSIQVLIDDPK